MVNEAKTRSGFVPGRGYSREDWDAVCDNPEWTKEDFASARRFRDVFPQLAGEKTETDDDEKGKAC